MIAFIEYMALFGFGFVAGYALGVISVYFLSNWPGDL
jgi:hypothetical protein